MCFERIKGENGKEYQIVNGAAYSAKTHPDVIAVLDRFMKSKSPIRVRIFYGDAKTGRDWNEEHDVVGYMGKSNGVFKIPLLLAKSNSDGGTSILDDCIVKITVDKEVAYKHPNYHCARFEIRGIEKEDPLTKSGYVCRVVRDGREVMANFKSEEKARNYVQFMLGERNRVA